MDQEGAKAMALLERLVLAVEKLADTYEMMFECQRIATERAREAMDAVTNPKR